jgi:hypothetical protein
VNQNIHDAMHEYDTICIKKQKEATKPKTSLLARRPGD